MEYLALNSRELSIVKKSQSQKFTDCDFVWQLQEVSIGASWEGFMGLSIIFATSYVSIIIAK